MMRDTRIRPSLSPSYPFFRMASWRRQSLVGLFRSMWNVYAFSTQYINYILFGIYGDMSSSWKKQDEYDDEESECLSTTISWGENIHRYKI